MRLILRGRYLPGQTVAVTATLTGEGVGLARLVAGGVDRDVDSTTATFEVTFDVVACMPVTPVDPTVMQATCTDGEVTVPTVTPASGPAGVSYALVPPGPYDGHR